MVPGEKKLTRHTGNFFFFLWLENKRKKMGREEEELRFRSAEDQQERWRGQVSGGAKKQNSAPLAPQLSLNAPAGPEATGEDAVAAAQPAPAPRVRFHPDAIAPPTPPQVTIDSRPLLILTCVPPPPHRRVHDARRRRLFHEPHRGQARVRADASADDLPVRPVTKKRGNRPRAKKPQRRRQHPTPPCGSCKSGGTPCGSSTHGDAPTRD